MKLHSSLLPNRELHTPDKYIGSDEQMEAMHSTSISNLPRTRSHCTVVTPSPLTHVLFTLLSPSHPEQCGPSVCQGNEK